MIAEKMNHEGHEGHEEMRLKKTRSSFPSLFHRVLRVALLLLVIFANPAQAKEGTIRKKWASSIEHNAIHGSDAEDTARFELSFFFAGYELAQ